LILIKKYEPIDILNGHTDSVFVCDAIYDQESTIVCSSSADSSVKLWYREKLNEKFECLQTLASKSKGFALALKIFNMPILNGLFFR
jgi:WD40 repeat protein